MKRTVAVTVVFVLVLVTVYFPSAASQYQQPRSVSGSSGNNASVGSSTRNRETSGRMISTSGKRNKIRGGDDNESESDSAFDNGPTAGRDSSEITFPGDDILDPIGKDASTSTVKSVQSSDKNVNKTQKESKAQGRWKTIPLDALVKFGTESNLASFFSKYVKNTKVIKDNETQEEYVLDGQGKPIFDEPERGMMNKDKAMTPMTRIQTIKNPFIQGRRGGQHLETTARVGLDLAMPRSEKQDRVGLSLPVCNPELTTVPVPLESLKVDPTMLVVPKCFKVKRCGGCCLSDLTVCEAETKETVRQSVTLLGYDGDNDGSLPKLQFLNTTTVELEQHKTCKCKCRTKKEHCKSHHHSYDEGKCSCVCTNSATRVRCEKNPENRFWDNETCQCTCQEVKECSSGFYFDLNTCDCQRVPPELESRAKKPIGG